MMKILESIKDPYERKARVIPGLIVTLPILVPLVCVYGAKNPLLTALSALLGGSGAIYALANIARGLGKRLEEQLANTWGGMPTTIILRHRDSFLDSVTKARHHDAIRDKLGIQPPTSDEERTNPARADSVYVGATRRLRELTRGNKGLLFRENIAYGFHRNMLAMKPIGILTSVGGFLSGVLMSGVISLNPPFVNLANIEHIDLSTGLTLLVSLALCAAWLFYFNEGAVRRIGFAYAERLFECLPTIRKRQPVVARSDSSSTA